MVSIMFKISVPAIATLALFSAIGSCADAAPKWPAEAALANGRAVRLAHSPLPAKLRQGADILLVRSPQQAGGASGGCWNHCFNSYDECLGIGAKTVCLTQIKTCMETCDKLSGMANPMRRDDR
jgi:hypothetical protein